MLKKLLMLSIFISVNAFSQIKVITTNKLVIKHDDITLYLSDDTLSLASKHVIKYSNFIKIDHERDNRWFQDTYSSKYHLSYYIRSGYDLGHLTPSDITSYDNKLNHLSFSLFNQAPQLAGFNRGKWARLEKGVYDSIKKYKKNSVIITGVIYDQKNPQYLRNSDIKIPISFYKILMINKKTYCWIGSNINGQIVVTDLLTLNQIFKLNNLNIVIK